VLLNCINLKASDEFTGRPTRLTAFEFKVITQIVGAFAKCQPAQIPITNHRNLGPVTKKKVGIPIPPRTSTLFSVCDSPDCFGKHY